ncbi:HEPN domain-containing protein [Amycolatopsis tolypomycina]|uniref:HEPN domain-containing protein n=1 Tax=Amycolatopsis tolypomycina TaxID=208445 RepID=UPI0033BC6621
MALTDRFATLGTIVRRWLAAAAAHAHAAPAPSVSSPSSPETTPIETTGSAITWQLANGNEIHGHLDFPTARRVSGTAFGLPMETSAGSDVDSEEGFWVSTTPRQYGTLRGLLRNGHDVALLNAQVTPVLPEHTLVGADLALRGPGLRANTDLLFPKFRFQVGGLTELAGVAPLKLRIPRTLAKGTEFSGTWTAPTQTWTTAEGDTITLDFVATINAPSPYELRVRTSPIVTVTGTARPAPAWLRDYARPLAELTSLATTQPQAVTWAAVGDDTGEYQLLGREITQERYDADLPKPDALPALFRCGPGGTTLPDLLTRWTALANDQPVFVDYLRTVFRNPLPVTSRFVALIAALEGFHTAKHGSGPLGKKEFDREKDAVFKRLKKTEGVSEDDRAWLRQWGNYFGSYELHERFRRLAADLPKDLQHHITAAVQPIPPLLHGIMNDPIDIWQLMGKARNNLAHGNTPQSTDQLTALTRLGHTLAVATALQELGLTPTHLDALMRTEKWSIV